MFYRNYGDLPRDEADRRAVADVQEYLSSQPGLWERLTEEAKKTGDIRAINFSLAFAGVSGYPFHAFCRTNCLEAYRNWMHSGDDAVATDEAGFPLLS